MVYCILGCFSFFVSFFFLSFLIATIECYPLVCSSLNLFIDFVGS